MYVERILGLFEGQEGKIMSVRDVSEALALSKHETGNALLQMTKGDDAPLDRRRGRGASYLYFLKVHDLFNQPEI
jgi:hypothetical protein